MGKTREFRPDDIPETAALWQRMFRPAGVPSLEPVIKYFHAVFFGSPWQDAELPSWVYEHQGRIVGFLGVLPRRMLFNGEPIRSAVITQLMVEPHAGAGIAALDMIRRYFNGSQDLCWTDGANAAAEKLWVRLGGEIAYLYSQEWRRVLRPARFAANLLNARPAWRRLAKLAGPICWSIDAAAVRLPIGPYRRKPVHVHGEEATAGTLLACYQSCLGRRALQPVYSADSLDWLLEMLQATTGHGRLRKTIVRNDRGASVGWYLYYVKPDAEAKVLQIGGTETAIGTVLDHLFEDARQQGALAICGQMEPRLLRELSDHHCRFHCHSFGVLVQSRDRDLLHAIHRGDAALTRLEGEWWLRFGSDRFEELTSAPVVGHAAAQQHRENAMAAGSSRAEAGRMHVTQAHS